MSFPSHSFIKPQLTDRSFLSQQGKKQPFLYSNSSTKIDQCEFEVQKMRDKYQKEFNKFYRDRHRRSKSQIQKIERIIRDASDLNEILNDANKWLAKRDSPQKKDSIIPGVNNKKSPTAETTTVKWKTGKKIDL